MLTNKMDKPTYIIRVVFMPGKEARGNLYLDKSKHARKKGIKIDIRPDAFPLRNGDKVTCQRTGLAYRVYGLTYIKSH